MDRPGLKFIVIGAALIGVGLGLVQVGIKASRPCVDCEDDPTQTIADVAQASAEMDDDQ